MNTNARHPRNTQPGTTDGNPLELLADALESDMRDVNARILERMDSGVPLIRELSAYIISAGGKRIRPLLTLASTAIHGGAMGRAQNLAACVEFIHTATLLHDDVVDESDERRGKATANTVFGNQASVLVGDFLFSRAFQVMTEDGSLDVLRILSDASAIIAQGEVMQLMTAGNTGTTMQDYLEVIQAKTAALFAAACEIGPVIAGASLDHARAMAEYGMNLGIAFQIIDDVLDYSSVQEKLGKNPGDDFKEGKMTAPVIFALEKASAPEKEFWTRTIRNLEQTDDDLRAALDILHRHGALDQSAALAKSYAEKAEKALERVPQNPLTTHLKDLILFTVNREY